MPSTKNINLLSLFSGCGGMDIGFSGNFKCLRKSVNKNIHPDWIVSENDNWVNLAPTMFNTVSLMIYVQTQKPHGFHILKKKTKMPIIFITLQVLLI